MTGDAREWELLRSEVQALRADVLNLYRDAIQGLAERVARAEEKLRAAHRRLDEEAAEREELRHAVADVAARLDRLWVKVTVPVAVLVILAQFFAPILVRVLERELRSGHSRPAATQFADPGGGER